eukprot:CAMPEP_0202441730 /NCGR_PEP_ID=MMETSP1360-20130828/1227_1 /ASSEMBLY_ACC=CAM_ASM_000848 /TAXON_ID=515479 /ORGANISM="Licmophora paradoxa, Strain CCMP2313" /LENGTH=264 /DNA_ID=CAMNT_0049056833 /DNA_START=157 /DNA_END=951 /DNA_ORIENTATION=-
MGVAELYQNILKNEGVVGLWAGNGANLLRVFPAKATIFASNDKYKQILRDFSNTPESEPLSGPLSFLAGGLSGMTASAATYPLDLARGRITGKLAAPLPTTAGKDGAAAAQKQYSGILGTVALTVRDEGFLGLYKGATPTLLGAMPYEGIKFGTVGILEIMLPLEPDQPPTITRKMAFGGLGGAMAGVMTYPNDTVRRLLQLQGSRGTSTQFTGYLDAVRKTYRDQGIRRFYRGCGLNLIRMVPNTAVQFGSYELLKQWTAGMF